MEAEEKEKNCKIKFAWGEINDLLLANIKDSRFNTFIVKCFNVSIRLDQISRSPIDKKKFHKIVILLSGRYREFL